MVYVNRELDYAIQFVIAIAQKQGKPMSIQSFSKESAISFLFLQKIAKKLREASIIISIKGPTGGYILQREPEHISIKHIWEAITGAIAIVDCLRPDHQCAHESTCQTKHMFLDVQTQFVASLEHKTIADCISTSTPSA